jgi:hypothetical protein
LYALGKFETVFGYRYVVAGDGIANDAAHR